MHKFLQYTQRVYHLNLYIIFFFNDTATTEIYTLSLHDALPICSAVAAAGRDGEGHGGCCQPKLDRKSTRLNSSHLGISYAVFCLKQKKVRHVCPLPNTLPNILEPTAIKSMVT